MVYKVIGLMSGSSLDGLDIAFVHLQETVSTSKDGPRKWEYTFQHTTTYAYTPEWKARLAGAAGLPALDYQLLHVDYGHYLGELVNRFVEENGLHYQVQLIASHGHTAFHVPGRRMTAQLGDGAALAAATGVNVVSDLRAMDLALGGQGAPIVPIGEKLMLPGYDFFLNLGGIANISMTARGGNEIAKMGGDAGATGGNEGTAKGNSETKGGDTGKMGAAAFVAYDVCPANRVLNLLAGMKGKDYDEDGAMAAGGQVDEALLARLNALPYYGQGYPKSLGNEFGTDVVLPMIKQFLEEGGAIEDAMRTYVEHIAFQIARAVQLLRVEKATTGEGAVGEIGEKMLVTGGGAHNIFMTGRLRELLAAVHVELVVPEPRLIDFKEALVMALIGVLRWREEKTVMASVTGARRDSIGGAVWIGQE